MKPEEKMDIEDGVINTIIAPVVVEIKKINKSIEIINERMEKLANLTHDLGVNNVNKNGR
ncbi:MAG: hypothetical protein GY853_13460 [PVC group bacterium]|nr:hypothetical protein [PVC group bacterium]